MADRKRPRDERPDDDVTNPGAGQAAGGMAGLASSAPGTPARTLRRLRQGIAPQQDVASSLGGSDDDNDFLREDEDELRRADDVLEEADNVEEDDEGEDLFGDGLEADYAPNLRLDQYDEQDMDETEYEQMDLAERRALEARLGRRDREEGRGRLPAAYLDSDDQESEATPQLRRRRVPIEGEGTMDVDEAEQIVDIETLEDMRGTVLMDYILQDGVSQYFEREFKAFLTSFTDEEDVAVYAERIKAMCESNGESLEVSYMHLSTAKPTLAYVVSNAPAEALRIFDRVAMDVTLDIFAHYDEIRQEIHVRISDLPYPENLRDLRQSSLNCLIRVSGVVTRRTSVFPQLKYVKYDCGKCGATLGPFYQDIMNEIKLNNCPQCQSKGPFNVNSEQTIYRNYQRMTLQETPGSVPAGRLPRTREVILLWDLIDSARPGEEVDVIGIYRNNFNAALNSKNGFPVFATVIEANYISRKEDQFAAFRLTEDDEKTIQRMSQDERIGAKIIKSIAPSIFGHEDVKTAVALALFGGVAKNPLNKHRIRGDINVLMLGDPGTAKSQLLKYIEKTANRAVYTTGQGASAVGLTASVRKDPLTREWTLEGGALVLADKGVCLIDEFDKMNDQDRTSIHEAMEQQTISISKAGIVTSLQARCTVFAAANPVRGRYDPRIPFNMNVELTEPILSRFDVLCVIQDRADPVVDGMLAEFVVDSHVRSHPKFDSENNTVAKGQDRDIIPQDLLKKYIMYAKERVQPKLGTVDADRLSAVYAELRRASLVGDSIPITVRHLESMIRMAEANARMHLREEVRSDDVNMAIRVMIDSFVKAQKWSVRRQMQKQFLRYINFNRDNDELLNHILADIVRDHVTYYSYKHGKQMPERLEMDAEDFEARARELNIYDVSSFYRSNLFNDNRYTYDAHTKMIVKAF